MIQKLLFLFAAAVFFLQGSAAFAEQTCEMKETATVNLSFNGVAESPEKILENIESKAHDIQAMATAKGAAKFDLQSKNYSINSASGYGNAGGYNYSGNYSYLVEPAALALSLMQEGAKNGMQTSMSVNAYRQCQ
jgi:hypothetical protein